LPADVFTIVASAASGVGLDRAAPYPIRGSAA
jgi:hypothetical protein